MEYLVGLAIFGLIVYGTVKAVSGNRYAEMSEEEFEADAKRASQIAPAIMSFQKVIDPSHRVEHVQEQNEKIEAESAESGDRLQAGAKTRETGYEIPE